MIVTALEARVLLVDALDAYIRDRVDTLERQIRADLAATGPEAEDELDAPPVRDADWTRVSVEEVLLMERTRLEHWRDRVVAAFDDLP